MEKQMMVQYAVENTIYYKKIPHNFKEWNEIPILRREELYDYSKFISKQYSAEDLVENNTSGSTGKILSIFWNKHDLYRSFLSLWRIRKQEYNIAPSDRMCKFHSSSQVDYGIDEQFFLSSPRIILSRNGKVLSFSKINLTDDILLNYYKTINGFRPKWFFSQPSIMFLFSTFIVNNGLPILPFVELIELTGEYFENTYMAVLKKVFPKAQITNHYGCQEVNGIAYSCKYGNLHCIEDNVYTEIINKNEFGEGNICVTSLRNTAMPIIRYMLDDIGYFESNNICKCGNKGQILRIKSGRNNDFIKIMGEDIDSSVFYYIIQKINEKESLVLQFKIIQESETNFIVYLVLGNSLYQNFVKKFFLDCIQEYKIFNNCSWHFEFVKRINLGNDSKLFYFKREF